MARVTPRPDYEGAAERWATGAALVYGPLAATLLDQLPAGAWDGGRALDVGAGTGAASDLLTRGGARVVALDLSAGMLGHERHDRPPAAVADVARLPVRRASVDVVVAAFVLNHVTEPVAALAEVAQAVRPGGWVAASVFAATSRHAGRDRIDEVVAGWGWTAPAWYAAVKERAVPLLATASAMTEAAADAGLVDVRVTERAVDVGVTTPAALVDYRLGQAHVTDFLRALDDQQQAALRREAIAAVGEPMAPYRPEVVLLAARAPDRPA